MSLRGAEGHEQAAARADAMAQRVGKRIGERLIERHRQADVAEGRHVSMVAGVQVKGGWGLGVGGWAVWLASLAFSLLHRQRGGLRHSSGGRGNGGPSAAMADALW